MSLAQKRRPADSTSESTAVVENGAGCDTSGPAEPEHNSRHDTGTMVTGDQGTSYIDSANWRAILEEVGFARCCSAGDRLTVCSYRSME